MANVQASTQAVEALFTQVFRDGDYDLADKILTDDFRFQYPFPGFAPGPEGIKQFSREFHQGFPGFEVEVNDLFGTETASGEAEVTIGSDHYRLAPETVVLTPPHVPQSFAKVSDEILCFYTVHFTAQVYGLLDVPSLYRLPSALTLPASRSIDFQEAARRIVEELAGARPGCTLAAGGECARMLAWLWRETVDRDAVHGRLPDRLCLDLPVFRVEVRVRGGHRLA